MTYQNAKYRVARNRLIGLAIMAMCSLVTVVCLLKLLYFGLDGGGALLANLSYMLKRFVYAVYEKTNFFPLSIAWDKAPVPSQTNLFSISNLWFLCWYIGVFVGASVFSAANNLASRLRGIDRQIEDELIRDSIRNGCRRTRQQIEGEIEIPPQSLLKEIHTLYVAPIVVGLLLLVLGKLFGLSQ